MSRAELMGTYAGCPLVVREMPEGVTFALVSTVQTAFALDDGSIRIIDSPDYDQAVAMLATIAKE